MPHSRGGLRILAPFFFGGYFLTITLLHAYRNESGIINEIFGVLRGPNSRKEDVTEPKTVLANEYL